MVSGCGVCVKFWQKCCPDQRRVFSYCPKKNHLNAVHLKLLGEKKNNKTKTAASLQTFHQYKLHASGFNNSSILAVASTKGSVLMGLATEQKTVLNSFGTFHIKKLQLVKKDTITSIRCFLPESKQKQGRNTET